MSDSGADAVPEWVLDRITDEGVLSLRGEDLGGEIPAWVCQLTDLRGLNLANCRLSGAISPELGRLTNLTRLRLDGNQLSDAIPSELGQLTSLTTLWLNGNQLAGAIPPELGRLTDLTALRLDGNQLSGAIPPELGQLTDLTILQLDGNQLSGPIPPELGQLTDLIVLRLDPEQTDGELPRALQQLVTRSTAQLDGEIAEMIAAGESTTVEFRAILRGSRGDRKPEQAVLKSIAAFLNTDGGTLVIGVDDDGNPLGLDGDGFLDNEDQMARYLSGFVSDRLGAGVWGNIDIEFASYQGRRILVIRCTQSSTPILVGEDDEFYARIGPTTRRLTPREMVDYVRIRF